MSHPPPIDVRDLSSFYARWLSIAAIPICLLVALVQRSWPGVHGAFLASCSAALWTIVRRRGP